jgi:hypothetical protein
MNICFHQKPPFDWRDAAEEQRAPPFARLKLTRTSIIGVALDKWLAIYIER